MKNNLKKRQILKFLLWISLFFIAAVSLPKFIKSVFDLNFKSDVITYILLILGPVPNLLLFLEYLVYGIKQKLYLNDLSKICDPDGQEIPENEIEKIEHVVPGTLRPSLALLNFNFYNVHLTNGKKYEINCLTFNRRIDHSKEIDTVKVLYPSMSLI